VHFLTPFIWTSPTSTHALMPSSRTGNPQPAGAPAHALVAVLSAHKQVMLHEGIEQPRGSGFLCTQDEQEVEAGVQLFQVGSGVWWQSRTPVHVCHCQRIWPVHSEREALHNEQLSETQPDTFREPGAVGSACTG
jgi:hypothetical protein